MLCISSSKPCVVGNGDHYHEQSKMESHPELITWVFLWNTFIPFSLVRNFAAVPYKTHCGLCPAQAVGRGTWTPCCISTQPAQHLGQREMENCFSTLNYLFPGERHVFEGLCCSGWAILKDVFPSPPLPSAATELEESQSSPLAQGMATAEKSSSTGTNLPHLELPAPIWLWGCQDKCPNQSTLREFHSVHWMEFMYFNCAFFSPKIFVLLAIPHKQNQLYSGATFSKSTCDLSFFASLSGAERHRELPPDPQLCANLPPLNWKSNGHKLTRCFTLEYWNFVFPVLFQGWAVVFFIHNACILPSLSCVSG